MATSTADVDIICHSRGGLVTRWFMEAFDRPNRSHRRAVLVGSPLHGTSLAAPGRIRNSINLFTNIGKELGCARRPFSTRGRMHFRRLLIVQPNSFWQSGDT